MSCSQCNLGLEEAEGFGATSNCHHIFCLECIELKVKRSKFEEVGCSTEEPDGCICRGYFDRVEIRSLVPEEVFEYFVTKWDAEKRKRLLGGSSVDDTLSEEDMKTPWGQVAQMLRHQQIQMGLSYDEATKVIDAMPVWTTTENISCVICGEDEILPPQGVILKNCFHAFCRVCLRQHIQHSQTTEVVCPFVGDEDNYSCDSMLMPKELLALSSRQEYIKHYEDNSMKFIEGLGDIYNCRTANCGYMVSTDDSAAGAFFFRCPKCKKGNCIQCQVLHEGTCAQYKQRLIDEENERKRLERELRGREDQQRRDRLNRLEQQRLERISEVGIENGIRNGIYMKCPRCSYVCHKWTGCNHVVCSSCKSQFNWTGK